MTLMHDETRESAHAAARCLAQRATFAAAAVRLRALDPALVVVCARGSSGHAGTFLRYLLARSLGVVAAAAMPSVASLYGVPQRMRGALFVAISQSGRSPDLVAQTAAARASGAFCLALVNDPASPLAAACDMVVDIAAGPERSVAATKSVIASMVAALAITAGWSGDVAMQAAADALPERLAQAMALDWSVLPPVLAGIERLLVVGRGPGLAVAAEAALKLSETTGIAGLAYSSAELAHGPRVLAGPTMPVLGFVQDDAARPGTLALLRDLSAQAPVLAAGVQQAGVQQAGVQQADADQAGIVALPALAARHPDADLVPMLACFYLAAEAAARARGRDPDHPPGLLKVTETM